MPIVRPGASSRLLVSGVLKYLPVLRTSTRTRRTGGATGALRTGTDTVRAVLRVPVIYPTVRDDFGLISMIEMDFAPVRMTGRMSGKSEMPHFCNEKRPDQGKLLTLAV